MLTRRTDQLGEDITRIIIQEYIILRIFIERKLINAHKKIFHEEDSIPGHKHVLCYQSVDETPVK